MKSIAAKMCEVMKRVRYIQKTGRNTFHKYTFLEESELVGRIGEAMAEVGIAYFPEVIDVQHIPDAKDKGILTTITVSATFACSDTGESHTVRWSGVGHDALDKGIYKAMTGANKYLLMKTFMVSTGDEPEQDEPVIEVDKSWEAANRRLRAIVSNALPNKEDREAFFAAIKKDRGVESGKDLTPAQLNEIADMCEQPGWAKKVIG